jgi:hypothetical protein
MRAFRLVPLTCSLVLRIKSVTDKSSACGSYLSVLESLGRGVAEVVVGIFRLIDFSSKCCFGFAEGHASHIGEVWGADSVNDSKVQALGKVSLLWPLPDRCLC